MSGIGRVLIAGVVAVALSAAPAGAHSGGRAQLYVDSVRLELHAGGWHAELILRDADSGTPEPGFGVLLSATPTATARAAGDGNAVGPVTLTDADADGRYSADVPMTDGAWTVTVQVAEIPGGPRAVPFRRTWPVTLRAGRAIAVGGSAAPPAGHRAGGGFPAVPLGLGLGAAVAVVLALRRYRPGERAHLQPTRPSR